jgi:hypothetical protein
MTHPDSRRHASGHLSPEVEAMAHLEGGYRLDLRAEAMAHAGGRLRLPSEGEATAGWWVMRDE